MKENAWELDFFNAFTFKGKHMKQVLIRNLGVASILVMACSLVNAKEKLPAQQVISAIQTAVSYYPGQVKEMDVDKEHGRFVVEVEIENDKGNDKKIKVDAADNKVIE